MHRKKEKGSKQEETARIHKREAGPSLRPRGSHASPKSTDPAEAAPVPSMDPRCTGRSCAHLTYIFFAQCSWLELSGTPPEFWIPCQVGGKITCNGTFQDKMLVIWRGNNPLCNANRTNGIRGRIPNFSSLSAKQWERKGLGLGGYYPRRATICPPEGSSSIASVETGTGQEKLAETQHVLCRASGRAQLGQGAKSLKWVCLCTEKRGTERSFSSGA